ncbi:hypothetical protein BGZ70_003620 [Mortierella alpina]|uniref:Ion transport domain-containing protein n=1 Tax=Mortierella alpina TaxID=64518 RepID=A0A9P6LVQ1_MORAP|nr:hypothetical protein BGZ70_003620 [Mortierella alpina]
MQSVAWHSDLKKQETEDDQENDEGEDGQGKDEVRSALVGEDATDDPREEQHPDNGQLSRTLTFPRSAEDAEKYRYENGIVSLLDTYADSDEGIKEAIIRFLADRIRPSSKETASSLEILCHAWTYSNRAILEKVMARLLPDSGLVTWIPDINATKKKNPLLKKIMKLFPEEAREYLRRIAYVPISGAWRDYIVENSIVIYSPWHCIQSRSTPPRLDKIKKPALQLHVKMDGPRLKANTFHQPIYVAAFDALWHFTDKDESKRKQEAEPWWRCMQWSMGRQESLAEAIPIQNATTVTMQGTTMVTMQDATTVTIQDAMAATTGPDPPTLQESTIEHRTTWWKTAYHMLRLKCHLKTHTYVTCHDFKLEFLDNPALAALVAYKWNTIGYAYWVFRFFFQCVFYALVFVAALFQVYREHVARRHLEEVFVTIIVVGAIFLWLEVLQAFKNFERYTRIYKSVCKYVFIIRQSVFEIRVFFFIFAGGLVAFTIAFLHLLRACPMPGALATKFSSHFLGALSATYFIMGGRYDPISTELESEDWAFHVMLSVYFFFTVIVMLNVLIALINKAFARGDDDWRKDWILSRLHYIELAENLSYHIPGFRKTHNWFPKEIYFTAADKEVKEYSKEALETQVQDLKTQLSLQQKDVENQLGQLKELLLHLVESSKAETNGGSSKPETTSD